MPLAMIARSNIDDRILDEAIAWHHSLARDDADWDGYVAWLETDSRHRDAFDEVALLDRMIDDHTPTLARIAPAPGSRQRGWRSDRRRWLGGAVAVGIAVAVGLPMVSGGAADTVYQTGHGQTRRIALDVGSSIELAPSSRLLALGGDRTRLRLEGGEAYFRIAHRPERMLSIQAGSYAVSDIGTTFGVNLASDMVTVAVAEGDVSVARGGGDPARLAAGHQFVASLDGASATVRPVQARNVGSWREGRLIYDDTPLRVVVADLARYSGKTVTYDRGIASRRFSGVLTVVDGARPFQNLADLMSLSYHVDGDRVRLAAAFGR